MREGFLGKLPPRTISVLIKQSTGVAIAHALDVDIVAEAADSETALKKLRHSLKVYFEYGINNGLVDQIVFPAPDAEWAMLKAVSQPPTVTANFGMDPLVMFQAMLNESRNTPQQAFGD